jgi:CRISPR-associated protein Cmr6
LGGENVLETGLTLHHTYGVPFIPGSAIKGLAAHYAAQVWGLGDSKWVHDSEKGQQGEYHRIVFGDQSEAGFITFWDAWITPDSLKEDGSSGLVLDVMTPHHQDYNMGKTYSDGPRQGQLIPPTGFDNPVPVSFLSVAGTFLVGVSCDDTGEEGRKCARLALDLIGEALENWGIGGKTSSGYGRMKFNKKEPTTGIQGENEIRSPK